jgi:sugar O-acyltransferase (sialic acid O-acetyltransferase NeuD family)
MPRLMQMFGVFGVGGFGREVMPLVKSMVGESQGSTSTRLFFVDDYSEKKDINGYPVLTFDEFCRFESISKNIVVAIAGSNARKAIHCRMLERNVHPCSVRAPNSVVLQNAQIGEGCILCPFTSITSNVVIGKFFQLNLYSYVAHDCSIGDFVTFAPSVRCNGHVVIEDEVYIGTGAIIKQGKPGRPLVIGKGAKIEAGSYVTKDVEPGSTVFGNPAVKMTLSSFRNLKSLG